MNIQAEKIELAKMLLDTENVEIIQSIRQIFKKKGAVDSWDELTPAQREEIQKASKEIEEGKFTDYEIFMDKHRE